MGDVRDLKADILTHDNYYYSGRYFGFVQVSDGGTIKCRVRDALGIYETKLDIAMGECYK